MTFARKCRRLAGRAHELPTTGASEIASLGKNPSQSLTPNHIPK